MGAVEALGWLLDVSTRELTLFAAVGLLIGGIDELMVDAIWLIRAAWRRGFVYTRHSRATVDTLGPPDAPGRIAVFIGAWDESAVIGEMLRTALARFEHDDYRVYVGVYPNDPWTIMAVEAVAREDARIRMVDGLLDGPTSNAECLNRLWAALVADERGIMHQTHQGRAA